MESKFLHFTVDAEGVVEFAREKYWFQDAKKHGVRILNCFIGIEPYQITRILEGDATLKEDPDNKIYYYEEVDEDFKQKLKDFHAYNKTQLDYYYFGGTKVNKGLVDEYANHVVKRLRESMRNTKHGVMFDMKDMDEILGLETRRRELHDDILEDAGFDRDDTSIEACEFKSALDDYVDQQAGTILEVPLGEMSEDEIIEKRKQSESIMQYMDDMNVRMAKVRGII